MRRLSWIGAAIAIVIAGLIGLGLTTDFLVDWTWYFSIGYLSVFWTIVGAKTVLFIAVFVATVIVILANGFFAARAALARAYLPPANSPWEPLSSNDLPAVIERFVRRLLGVCLWQSILSQFQSLSLLAGLPIGIWC